MLTHARPFVRRAGAVATCIALTAGALAVTVPAGAGASPSVRATALCGTKSSVPVIKHVIVVIEENHSYGDVVRSGSAPYLNRVIASCGLASNYHNLTHNSLPNYLALVGGGSLSALSQYDYDCAPSACRSLVGGPSVFSQVAARGWASYLESMPIACDRSSSGQYAVRHNPAAYFSTLAASCPANDVALGSTSNSPLLHALGTPATAPAFATVTPNLCNDMHDCSVSVGDAWLSKWLPLIASTAAYKAGNTAVFVVWDEGRSGYTGENCAANPHDQSCHVPLVVIAPSVRPGTKVSTSYSVYSLLRTFEGLLGVPALNGAATAISMTKSFHL